MNTLRIEKVEMLLEQFSIINLMVTVINSEKEPKCEKLGCVWRPRLVDYSINYIFEARKRS